MATLTANALREYDTSYARPLNEAGVIASDIIFEGAAVGESASTGTARPLVAGDTFLGFAVRKVDNSSGAASDKNVLLYTKGAVWLSVTGVDNIDHLGDDVYAADDNDFTTTVGSNTLFGKVLRYDAGTSLALVYFEALAVQSH